MISLHVKFDEQQIANAEAALAGIKGGAPKAMFRAINRTVAYGKTRASKLIREEYTINAGAVRAATSTEQASFGRLRGAISFKGRPKQLRNFARRSTPKGVAVSVLKRTGTKLIPRSFIRRVSSGPAILQRTGASRYPIEVLHGPSVPQMAGNVNVEQRIRQDVSNKLAERLEHEVDVLLRGVVR